MKAEIENFNESLMDAIHNANRKSKEKSECKEKEGFRENVKKYNTCEAQIHIPKYNICTEM